MNEKRRKVIKWVPEQRARHQAIRDAFRDWHPGPEELIASGAAARLGLDVAHFPAQDLLRDLKASREAAALTLAEVSARCGIDQPALSRLENGHTPNPPLDTLWRYAAAVGKRLVLSAEDIPAARPGHRKLGAPCRRKHLGGRRRGREAPRHGAEPRSALGQ
jgi:transcriptional regulator with XRE-family HTH domain